MKLKHIVYGAALAACVVAEAAGPEGNVAEEVVWTIGDRPIWLSEVEETRAQMKQEKFPIIGDPYCFVPEQIALERIYLHQADIDTVEANPRQIASEVDSRINEWLTQAGSREALESYMHKTLPEIRAFLTDNLTNNYRVGEVQKGLVSKVKLTPSQVRRYFDRLPQDSIPFVPTQVEVQIMTLNPNIPQADLDSIKSRLRGFADQVNRGEREFSTLAIMYSEDGSAAYGGEIGFRTRANLVPEYADMAFSLTDPKKASAVVETEYGYHILQLIEKRGERVNTRHILIKPKVTAEALVASTLRLDSIRDDILATKFTFEEATAFISDDKDTKNNHGLMTNAQTGNSLFEMSQLPAEVSRQVADLKPGQISKAFTMKDPKNGRDIVAIVKLRKRIDAHRADMVNDYQLIRNMALAAERQKILDNWIDKKISSTYIRVEPGWADCPNWRHNWLKK